MSGKSKSGLSRQVLVVGLVLLIPIVPFVVAHAWCEQWWDRLASATLTRPQLVSAIVIALSADILLPIPSTAVMTYAGRALGVGWGLLAAWSGLSLSAILGYALGRFGGRPLVQRLSNQTSLDRMQAVVARWGAPSLVLTRLVPVLAEATLIVCGMHRLPWHKMLWPVALANAGVACAYVALGAVSSQRGWFALALVLSVALPLGLLAWMGGQRHAVKG